MRKNLDLICVDVSRDMEIYSMSRKEIFNAVIFMERISDMEKKIADQWVVKMFIKLSKRLIEWNIICLRQVSLCSGIHL